MSPANPMAKGMVYSDQPAPHGEKGRAAQDLMKFSQRNLEKGRWKHIMVNYTVLYGGTATIHSIPVMLSLRVP